jgi:hypothetical protein
MKHSLILMGFLALSALPTQAQVATITVNNPTAEQRHEVIGVDTADVFRLIGCTTKDHFVVKDAFDNQVDYQLSSDGQLLIDASVLPHGTATFKVQQGAPKPCKVWAQGKVYPDRKDDVAWENDKTGFRLYGPRFQRDGDVGWGIDVWCKNTPDMVLPTFYLYNDFYKLSFHEDHDYGLDVYNVARSLGCGAPAVMLGDSIVFPKCYQQCRFLDNGPLRVKFALDFGATNIGKDAGVVEHRVITLDKGSHFCKMEVWYEGMKHAQDVAAGLVLHSDEASTVMQAPEYLSYSDASNNPKGHNFQIYTAVLFPRTAVEQRKRLGGTGDVVGHLLGVHKKLKDSERFTYYFGSAWSKADIKNQKMWQVEIESTLDRIKTPLTIAVK